MSLLSDSQVKLRLPTELKLRIESEAQESKRSMNAEIISRLEKSFDIDELKFKTQENELSDIPFNPYQLLNRRKELSDRLIHAIQWANFKKFRELKYSHIAEELGYETAEVFLEWIQGKQEPTFSELRTIGEFLGINKEWLVHGDGVPTPNSFFDITGCSEKDVAKLYLMKELTDHEIFNTSVEKIHFVRNISPEGELLIVRELKNGHVEVLETRAHISTAIGDRSRRTLQCFARLWAYLYKSYLRNSVNSYLLKPEKFHQIRQLYINPLYILQKTQTSFWWEEVWKKQPSEHMKDLLADQWEDWISTTHVASEGIKKE